MEPWPGLWEQHHLLCFVDVGIWFPASLGSCLNLTVQDSLYEVADLFVLLFEISLPWSCLAGALRLGAFVL